MAISATFSANTITPPAVSSVVNGYAPPSVGQSAPTPPPATNTATTSSASTDDNNFSSAAPAPVPTSNPTNAVYSSVAAVSSSTIRGTGVDVSA